MISTLVHLHLCPGDNRLMKAPSWWRRVIHFGGKRQLKKSNFDSTKCFYHTEISTKISHSSVQLTHFPTKFTPSIRYTSSFAYVLNRLLETCIIDLSKDINRVETPLKSTTFKFGLKLKRNIFLYENYAFRSFKRESRGYTIYKRVSFFLLLLFYFYI